MSARVSLTTAPERNVNTPYSLSRLTIFYPLLPFHKMTTAEKVSVYQIVTEQITTLLDQGIIPWKMGWKSGVPQNFITKRPYEGINAMMLAIQADCKGYSNPYWMTLKQCNEKGGKIKKGEKSQIVCFWKKTIKDEKKKAEGDNLFFMLRYYRVFNLDQCEGIEISGTVTQPINKLEACEKIVDGYKDAPVVKYEGARAYYSAKKDEVVVPDRNRFVSSEELYAALFHELAHSTGHEKRLNRQDSTAAREFGSEDYSKEELIAEFTAAFLCGITGIAPAVVENQAAYIQGWSSKLKEDSKLLITAAGKAQKAANYIQGIHITYPKES